MGGVPVKHRSYGKVRRVRSHHALKKMNIVPCTNCKGPLFGHRICAQCGFYKGKKQGS